MQEPERGKKPTPDTPGFVFRRKATPANISREINSPGERQNIFIKKHSLKAGAFRNILRQFGFTIPIFAEKTRF